MSDVINALKRLERAGDEQSRTTEKLRNAARTSALHIGQRIADVPYDTDLPRGYVRSISYIGEWPNQHPVPTVAKRDPDYPECHVCVFGTRDSALDFAADIATGWLDELAEWLEQAIAEDQQATQTLAERIS